MSAINAPIECTFEMHILSWPALLLVLLGDVSSAQRLTTNDVYTTSRQAALVSDLSSVGATLSTGKAALTTLGLVAALVELSESSSETVFSVNDWSVVEAVSSGTEYKWKAEFLASMIVASDIGRTLKLVETLLDEGGDDLLQRGPNGEGFVASAQGLVAAAQLRGSVQAIRWLVKLHRAAQPYLMSAQVPLLASRTLDATVTDKPAALSFADDVFHLMQAYLLEKVKSADYGLRPLKLIKNMQSLDLNEYNDRCRAHEGETHSSRTLQNLLEAAQ